MTQKKLVIFTDLDDTLLAKNDYSFSSAKPLLEKLKHYDIPLVINSSKTHTEIQDFKKIIALDTPHIVENGAAIIFDASQSKSILSVDKTLLEASADGWIKSFSIKREVLLDISNHIKEQHQFKYLGFNDMSVHQIAEHTQLSLDDSFAASQRDFSEPLLWQDSSSRLEEFKTLLSAQGISLQRGGRFLHLGGQCSKGKAMQWLLNLWHTHSSRLNPSDRPAVIALGDSKNDVSMLNNSDYAIVIKNKDSTIEVEGNKQTIYSNLSATSGWVETLSPLIDQFISNPGDL